MSAPKAFWAFPSMPTPLGPGQLVLRYQDTATQRPVLPAVIPRPHEVLSTSPSPSYFPQVAAAALIVCASGSLRGSPTGHVGSSAARIHAQTPWPQTRALPVVLQQTNQSVFAHIRRPSGPPWHMLGSCGWDLHFLGILSLLHSCAFSAPLGTRIWVTLGSLRLIPLLTIFISQEELGSSVIYYQPSAASLVSDSLSYLPGMSSPGPASASAVSAHTGVPGVTGCSVEGGVVQVSDLRNKQKMD